MSEDVRDQIRDFEYDLFNEAHVQFLRTAFSIGLLPQSLESCISEGGLDENSSYGIDIVVGVVKLKAVSLSADNPIHRRFVHSGLKIGLLPFAFLDYLEFGLQYEDFSSEDSDNVDVLMRAAERAIHKAFNMPIKMPRYKNFSQ